MGKRISAFIHKVSHGWVVLISLAIFVLFSALVLPVQSTRASTEFGDAGSPDMSFFYTPADLYAMAESYGEGGRQAYIEARFTFDLIWPLVYGVFFCTAISWVYLKAFAPDSPLQLANLAPVLGAAFDFLENISTSLVMARYPNLTVGIDNLAPVFTIVKWILVGGSMVLLLAGGVVGFWAWVQNRITR
jgi:hypothetical protein